MSFFSGAASSAGGGGYRFGAPSAAAPPSATSGALAAMTLSTASGAPPLTMQVLQKSTRPKLQILGEQIGNCKARAATVVKGAASQRQFNEQYSRLIGLLATAARDIDEELFFAVEAQNIAAAAGAAAPATDGASKAASTGAASKVQRIDPRKVPTAVNVHSLAKDLAAHIASTRGCPFGIPYLDMVAKSAIAAEVEKETAHERAAAARGAKETARREKEMLAAARAGAAAAAASAAAATTAGGAMGAAARATNSPHMMPQSIVVGGLPSPLQRPLGTAVLSQQQQQQNAAAGGSLFPAPPASSAAAHGIGAVVNPPVHDNKFLTHAVQPWLMPYPFSHGTKPERVVATRGAHARAQRVGFAVQTFLAKHPALAATVADSVPSHVAQQYAARGPAGSSSSSHPQAVPPAALPTGAALAGQLPPEVLLPHILSRSGLSRAQYYALAPRILEVCACPSAAEMLTRWEQREGVFDVFLNAPAVGADALGQVSSINTNANPPEAERRNEKGAVVNNSGAHVSLAMRSGHLGSIDNSQLFLGSPSLKPFHISTNNTPPMRPLPGDGTARRSAGGSGGAKALSTVAAGEMTPLILGGGALDGADADGDDALDDMAPLVLDAAGGDAEEEALKAYGLPPSHSNTGAAQCASGVTSAARRIGGGRGFFPHRCSNPSLLDRAAFAAMNGGGGDVAGKGGRPSSGFTVTSTATNSQYQHSAGKKRGREEGHGHRGSGGMFDVSPLISGIDPFAAAIGAGGGIDFFAAPSPPNSGKAPTGRGSGPVPALRASAGGTAAADAPSATSERINTKVPSDPSLIEAQPFLSVSARVMTCLLHFGVVTTEMPMMAADGKEKERVRHGR